MRQVVVFSLFIAVLAAPGRTQSVIHLFQGGVLGSSVAGVGDVDGDGFDDVAAADSHLGGVQVFSGRTGAPLLSLPVTALGPSFGNLPSYALDGAGDIDADGHADVLVGRVGDALAGPAGIVPTGPGSVEIFAGQGGSAIRSLAPGGPGLGQSFGFAAISVGDLDGDGVRDVVVGAPLESSNGVLDNGYVQVFSGATGQSLYFVHGAQTGDRIGQSLADAGDVDGDGAGDWLVTSLAAGGSARLVSGATGATIDTYTGGSAVAPPAFGMGFALVTVTAGADIDADGTGDVVLGKRGDPTGGQGAGIILAFSGADGSTLHTLTGSPCDGIGAALALADVDRDGFADILGGRRNDLSHVDDVDVWSGRTGDRMFAIAQLIPDVAQVAVAGDVDADGFADIVVGTDEYGPNAGTAGVIGGGPDLGPAADGSMVSPFDVLLVDGDAGGQVRRVDGRVGQPLTISVDAPPGNPQAAHFVVFGALFVPAEDARHALPSGLGDLCIPPAPLHPLAAPFVFTLAASGGNLGQLLTVPPAPWSVTFTPTAAATFTLQALVEETPLSFKAANGIVVRIR